MTAKRIKKESLWYCTQCFMSGAAKTKKDARNNMIRHFMSEAHVATAEKLQALDLKQRLAEHERRRAR